MLVKNTTHLIIISLLCFITVTIYANENCKSTIMSAIRNGHLQKVKTIITNSKLANKINACHQVIPPQIRGT